MNLFKNPHHSIIYHFNGGVFIFGIPTHHTKHLGKKTAVERFLSAPVVCSATCNELLIRVLFFPEYGHSLLLV
jgi:hypothetical protein